jgi:ADP-heptose:LPS heptosyltransferase
MRFIDRRAGVPLCFALSCAHRVGKIFKRKRYEKKPERILFIELSEMGSIVLAYALFKKTKELFPDAELYFLTFKENRGAADILRVFAEENVLTIDSDNFLSFISSALNVLWRLRRIRITATIDMELFARFTAVLSYLSGAKLRVGYYRYHNEGLYRGNFLTHKVSFNPHLHMAHNLFNLVCALDSPQGEIPLVKKKTREEDLILPKLEPSENGRKKILEKLKAESSGIARAKKIILLNPNASDLVPLRRWPSGNYVELAKLLLKNEGVYVVVTGTKSEIKEAGKLCAAVGSSRCINFAGKTSFAELVDLYHVSDALVTNDSGPVHFSSAAGIRTFAFFGPETPKLYGPLSDRCHVFYSHYACSPCISAFNHRKSACNDNKCLKEFRAADVYNLVKEKLELD